MDDRFLFRQSAFLKFFWYFGLCAFLFFQSRNPGETGDLVLALQDRAPAPGRAAAKLPCLDLRFRELRRENDACPGSFAWEWKCFYSSLLRDNCPVWCCYIPFKSQCGFVCFCSVELEYYSSLSKSMTHEFVTFSQSPELKHFRFLMLLGVVAIPLLTVASLHQGVRVSPCRVDCTCVSM